MRKIPLILLIIFLLSACSGTAGEPPGTSFTPTGTPTAPPTATPTPPPLTDTPIPTDTAVPTETPAPSATSTKAPCTDQAEFVKDVTIPDGTKLAVGQSFEKTWRIRNTGTCTWTIDYVIVFGSGDQMGLTASDYYPLTFFPVLPGEWVDVSVDLIAPDQAGSYTAIFQLLNEQEEKFTSGGFWVVIEVIVRG